MTRANIRYVVELSHRALSLSAAIIFHFQVAFFGDKSSINSFGFSPYRLEKYLEWLRYIVGADPKKKKIIISIGASQETELEEALSILRNFAQELDTSLGVEFNASCPNLNGEFWYSFMHFEAKTNSSLTSLPFYAFRLGSPPPAYLPSLLESYLRIFSRYASPQLRIGIKLPPYTYEEQIVSVVKTIETVSSETAKDIEVVSFLTSTNTLGQGELICAKLSDQCKTGGYRLLADFAIPAQA
jgi:dihydroorotate dehydrogenase (fumarate)